MTFFDLKTGQSRKNSEINRIYGQQVLMNCFTELKSIIQSGDIEKLREVIENAREIILTQSESNLLLTLACKSGLLESVKLLLDNRYADINYLSLNSESVLKSACISGNINLVNYIFDIASQKGIIINDAILFDTFRCIDMKFASSTDIAVIILDKICDINYKDTQTYCGDFLYVACAAGDENLVHIILNRGCIHYEQALYVASERNHSSIVKLLLDYNISSEVNQSKLIPTYTMLETAAKHGHLDIIKVLITDKNNNIRESTLHKMIYNAIQYNKVGVIAYLFENGYIDINTTSQYEVPYYMTYACKYGSNEIIRYLVTLGASLNAVDYNRKSPLEAAVMSHHLPTRSDTAIMLLDLGADPNQPFSAGHALLNIARSGRKECLPIAVSLLQHGADPNLADTLSGETPLMAAAMGRWTAVVELFLGYGSDVCQLNHAGKSVLDILGSGPLNSAMVELCMRCIKPMLK